MNTRTKMSLKTSNVISKEVIRNAAPLPRPRLGSSFPKVPEVPSRGGDTHLSPLRLSAYSLHPTEQRESLFTESRLLRNSSDVSDGFSVT